MDKKIIKHALVNAGITTAYILFIATLLLNMENIVGHQEPDRNPLVPAIMLMLLVISAAVTGFAVFGKPAMWYVDGKKKDAIQLLGVTIGFLAIAAILLITII